MKLTVLHDGSLRPRPSNLGKEPSKRPDRVEAMDIVPELILVPKHQQFMSGLNTVAGPKIRSM